MFLTQAFHRDIHLPRYVLLTFGWYSQFWWKEEQPALTCTADERESVLPSTLAITDEVYIQEDSSEINRTTTPGIVNISCSVRCYTVVVEGGDLRG